MHSAPVAPMRLEPTQDEVRAVMRAVARRERVHVQACVEVREFILNESQRVNRPVLHGLSDRVPPHEQLQC